MPQDLSPSIILQAGPEAFGDGTHPTTRGVLAALEAIDPTLFTPRIACDIGAGSGILTFAIARLFRCPVIATDIAAEAIATLKENAEANGFSTSPWGEVSARSEVGEGTSTSPLDPHPKSATRISTSPKGEVFPLQADGFNHPQIRAYKPFDLIVMNILAEPLLALAAEAEAHLAPEGVLIMSGLLQWQEPPLRAAYESLGLELTSRLVIGDWVTLLWQKP